MRLLDQADKRDTHASTHLTVDGSAALARCSHRRELQPTLQWQPIGRAREARPSGRVARTEHFARKVAEGDRLDLPDAARYERNALASAADAGGFEVRRADHHVDMRIGAVDAAGGP